MRKKALWLLQNWERPPPPTSSPPYHQIGNIVRRQRRDVSVCKTAKLIENNSIKERNILHFFHGSIDFNYMLFCWETSGLVGRMTSDHVSQNKDWGFFFFSQHNFQFKLRDFNSTQKSEKLLSILILNLGNAKVSFSISPLKNFLEWTHSRSRL